MLWSQQHKLISTYELHRYHIPIGPQLMLENDFPIALVFYGKKRKQVWIFVDSEKMEHIKTRQVLGWSKCHVINGLIEMDFLFVVHVNTLVRLFWQCVKR